MVDGADTFYTDWEETYESFDQMSLHENLLRGIYAYGGGWFHSSTLVNAIRAVLLYRADGCCCRLPLHPLIGPGSTSACCTVGHTDFKFVGGYTAGFEKPSAIQQKGIVPFGKGLDVIQQSQSGTGKTATFCAGILQCLDYGLVECQALVLAPTRELAQQIEKVMRALGDYLQVGYMLCRERPFIPATTSESTVASIPLAD